ncbi:MAG: 5-oxoprolinase subunit PxpB [Opitutaceae bacterium]|nr:5-oxoprolinase subunit PxpB [Opitutaceae bacterium]
MSILPLGDAAMVLHLDGPVDAVMAARVQAIAAALRRARVPGLLDVVPAFASVAVCLDPAQAPPAGEVAEALAAAAESARPSGGESARVVEVPVIYGGDHGPDLADVARHSGLAPAEVIARHAAGDYLVHAIGFAPGFPYLGGLDPRLATPRRGTPRSRVPAGSVGIGGAQTGVYPLATPGGWNVIGRTPLALFDARREPAALLHAGDRVRFRAVTESAEMFAKANPRIAAPPTPRGIEVLRAGQFTTVQDLGRVGHRAEGVASGGAADPVALRLANLLAGNREDAAALECTLTGPELRFEADAMIAWGGAEAAGLARWQPLAVRAGQTVSVGALQRGGCRGYLAVSGGIRTARELGSRSTCVRAGLGGLDGRALRDGDRLPLNPTGMTAVGRWHVDERALPHYSVAPTVRVVPGAQAGDFEALEGNVFTVAPQSDRMGVRLSGRLPRRGPARELVSAPVVPGTVQVPPDGAPIVLLADAQTIGGYPQAAHVITVDLPLVAQLRPGDTVRFASIAHDEARRLLLARERALGLLREGLAQKFH